MESSDKKGVFITFIVCSLLGYAIWQINSSVNAYFEKQAAADAHQAMVEQARVFAAPIEKALDASARTIAKATNNANMVSVGRSYTFNREEIEALNTKSDRQPASTETYDSSFAVVGLEIVENRFKIALVDDADSKKETLYAMLPKDNLFFGNLPTSVADVASLIDEPNKAVRASILIRETKAKVDRIIISWEPYDRNAVPSSP